MEEDYDGNHNNKLVGIIGLGFVGLPLAFAFIQKGFHVIGIDLDETKIKILNDGRSYIQDIKDDDISLAVSSRKLIVSKNYRSLREAGSIIICVPTPLTSRYTPDLSYLTDTCSRLFPKLQKGQLIILESSTYPGTTEEVVKPILERSSLIIGTDIFLAYSPERIDPGNKLSLEQIPKVVSGSTSQCLEKVIQLYEQIFDQIVPVTSTQAAETTKLLENTFRLINISFINEFAQICDRMGVDIWEIIDAARTKPYGFTAFYPGPGVGGHCIPVDPLYLQWKAKVYGIESKFITLSHQVNEAMPTYVLNQIKTYYHPSRSLLGMHILVYGVAYKKDTPDARESPAITLIQLLIKEGAKVTYHDPHIPTLRVGSMIMDSVDMTGVMLQTIDCVVIHTDHTHIPIADIMKYSPIVFDTRNATKEWKDKSNIIKLGGGH
ncbi:MAG: nucleotide sugar dehydrogenase [Paenibacillaceae bacterium]